MTEINRVLKVAAIQPDILWENIGGNLEKYRKILDTLSSDIDLVVLPEMFTTGFSMNPEKLAEDMNGTTMTWITAESSRRGVAIVGSFIAFESGKYYNRLVFAEASGNIHLYDKRHLFRMGEEQNHYSRGEKLVVINYRGWRIRPLVCYDLRFPVWSRNSDNYDMLIYVANWPESRRDVWLTLLKARAIENQSCLVGVNRVGTDGAGICYSGDSLLMDAKGKILAASSDNTEQVLITTFSKSELVAFRIKFPAWKDADDFSMA
jgi:Predicted amidohydrolase